MWEQAVGSSFACPCDGHSVWKLDNSEISAVELGVLMLRVGGSLRGWFNEFVKVKKLPGDEVYEELYLWIRAHELACCCDQLNLGGNCQPGTRRSGYPQRCGRTE